VQGREQNFKRDGGLLPKHIPFYDDTLHWKSEVVRLKVQREGRVDRETKLEAEIQRLREEEEKSKTKWKEWAEKEAQLKAGKGVVLGASR